MCSTLRLKIKKEVILAPMAGYTHSAFRLLCRKLGADRVYSELMNARGIIERGEKKELCYFTPAERPIHLQVYGRNPGEIAESARILAEKYRPDAIDINFGCSVKKVIKAKSAGYLLQFPEEMKKIVEETVRALKPYRIPVTAKIRLGFYEDSLEKIADALLEGGISAIALHPRLAVEGFSGKARWERVKALKEMAGNIPVIGSGDIKSWQEIDRKFEETGCDAVMIGRTALKHPWIFREYKEKRSISPKLEEKVSFLLEELKLMWNFIERERACRIIKSHACHLFKGTRGRSEINRKIMESKSCDKLLEALNLILTKARGNSLRF